MGNLLVAGLRRRRVWLVGSSLAGLLLGVAFVSLATGAVAISPARVVGLLFAPRRAGAQDALILFAIRLPRLFLAALIGAALAMSGGFMQGLFRNPLADPGLVGVSAGAGLAAAGTIVLGDRLLASWMDGSTFALLPAAAFFGALAAASLLYAIATRAGRTSMATMLLAGIALSALSSALTGFLTYMSNDRQLRDLAFWSLGSLGGATWAKVSALALILVLVVAALPFGSRGLNGMALGEAEAFHLGTPLQRTKIAVILLVSLAVGASVAAAGVISFVGIVVPHMLRLVIGPDHRALLPLCGMAGAALLAGADVLARSLVSPAELPVGVLTAALGAPFFLWLLLRRDTGLDE